jgi:hypothetical protein
MKTFTSTLVFVFAALLFACTEEEVTKNCGTQATVRDLTGLDGCWYVFELNDGTRLIPVWDMGYCGTPPLPKEVTEDPLYNFQFTDGKKVSIGYELRPDVATGCMAGKSAKITCLEELDSEIK